MMPTAESHRVTRAYCLETLSKHRTEVAGGEEKAGVVSFEVEGLYEATREEETGQGRSLEAAC